VVELSTISLENWHIDLLAEYLEAVTAGQIKRLLINMPPRYAKSTCVSIMWPTWVWARSPIFTARDILYGLSNFVSLMFVIAYLDCFSGTTVPD
jgi:hypothetical protein